MLNYMDLNLVRRVILYVIFLSFGRRNVVVLIVIETGECIIHHGVEQLKMANILLNPAVKFNISMMSRAIQIQQ